jgi:hypothetical protein
MPLFRATNGETQEVVEYDEPTPRTEHMSPPWSVAQVFVVEASPDDPAPTYDGPWTITRLAFRNRFTQAEKVTIELAALDDPAAPMATRQMAAALRVYLDDVRVASFVDLQRAETRAGVQQLEAIGLLAPGRASVILDTEPADEEVWRAS